MKLAQYQELAKRVREVATRIDTMKTARAAKIALAAGISPDGCCIHNAAIDDELTGWCYRNPARLKAAKLADRLWNDYTHYRIAERITARAWGQVEY